MSPSDVHLDSEPANRPQVDRSARVTSKKAGKRATLEQPSGAVNGSRDDHAREGVDEVSSGSSDVKSAARRVLEQLDNGLAGVILDDQAVRPRFKRRGSGLGSKSNPVTPPQTLRPEASTSDAAGLSQDSETLNSKNQEVKQRAADGECEDPKKRVVASSSHVVKAEPELRGAEDNGRPKLLGRTAVQLGMDGGVAKRSRLTERKGGLGEDSDGPVVVSQGEERGQQSADRGQQSRQLSSAERRAARKGMRVDGDGAPAAAEAGSPLRELLTSAQERRSREASGAASLAEQSSEAQAGARSQRWLPSGSQEGGRNAEGSTTDGAAADVSSRLLRAGEASTSGAANHRHVPTAGSFRRDPPPPWRSSRDRPPGGEDSSQGGRNGRPRDPSDRSFRRREVHEPLVLEVAGALRTLGRDVGELDSAVERAVPRGVLDNMKLEYWNEVIKLLGRGGWCRQMEAVLAYLPKAGYEPDETTYARVRVKLLNASSFPHSPLR